MTKLNLINFRITKPILFSGARDILIKNKAFFSLRMFYTHKKYYFLPSIRNL